MSATVFHAAPKWQRLRGFLHGFQQPVLSGWISVNRKCSIDHGDLLTRLEGIFEEPLPDASPEQALEDSDLVRLLLHTCGAVQRLCAVPVEAAMFVQVFEERPTDGDPEHDFFQVAMPSFSSAASVEAIKWSLALLNDLARAADPSSPHTIDVQARLKLARERLKPHAPQGINRFGMVQAALAARIFRQTVVEGTYQFGTGALARLLDSSVTDKTSALGTQLAASKWLTTQMLRSSGLPAPRQMRVKTEQEAVAAAETIGFPVVVKPENLEQGRGVSADLITTEQVIAAYQKARQLSSRIVVEKHIEGHTHRLTVIDGQIIRVTRRQAGGVTGNGLHDVITLLNEIHGSEDYQRVSRRLDPSRLALDEEAIGLLKQKGLTPQSIPAAGQYIRLRRRDNINAGGTNIDVELEDIHPANAQLALNAARLLRLDYAGVDLISSDITQPWWKNGAGICEINARPQLGSRNHETGYYEQILARLIGPSCHIPVHLELVIDPKDLREVIDRYPRSHAGCVASAIGLQLGDGTPTLRTRHGFEAAQMALRRTDVHTLTVVMTLSELQEHGLPVPFIDTLNITGDLDDDPNAWPKALVFAMPHIKHFELHTNSAATQTVP